MAISMDQYQEIRRRSEDGESIRKIAQALKIARHTVERYHDGENVPWKKQERRRDPTVLTDDVVKFIINCMDEDAHENVKKQQHTARRIFNRLVEEKGFTGGESTVRRKVQELRGMRQKVFIPLEFSPGDAMQVDWGETVLYLRGER